MDGDMRELHRRLFSIGHSNNPLAKFLDLLKKYQVEVLVDVRSHPFSRHAPEFNAAVLKTEVSNAGVKYYLYLGRELGGRPDGAEFYDAQGYVLYSRVAKSPRFLEGIRRLEQGIQEYRVAIMCTEEDPSTCHRRLLIGRVLAERGIALDHIRADGSLQTEEELARASTGGRVPGGQIAFPDDWGTEWRSTRSVSPKGRRRTSSDR